MQLSSILESQNLKKLEQSPEMNVTTFQVSKVQPHEVQVARARRCGRGPLPLPPGIRLLASFSATDDSTVPELLQAGVSLYSQTWGRRNHFLFFKPALH